MQNCKEKMYQMNDRRYEQGGVVSFLVVALALTALLVGGIFIMKQQARTARSTAEPVAVTSEADKNDAAKNDTKTPSTEKTPDTTPSTSETAPTANAPATTQNNGTAAPSLPSNASPQTTPTAPRTGPSEQQVTPRVAVTGPSMSEEAVGTLPSTGIEDIFAPMFAVGGVGTGLYVFVESQRKLRLGALK